MGKKLCQFFTDFSADARSEKHLGAQILCLGGNYVGGDIRKSMHSWTSVFH